MWKKTKKTYLGQTYYPAESYFGYVEEKRENGLYVDLNPDIVTNYMCNSCRYHTEYEKFLTEGFIDDEYARQNLYKCPVCGHINLITDYCNNDPRKDNLISNEEIAYLG